MRRKAFTLIELLVVIAIIAILLSVLFPALRAAKAHARSVVCSSNLSQIALKFAMYDEDNGSFPSGFDDISNLSGTPPGGYVGDAAIDNLGWWWFHQIIGEDISKGSISWCPSRKIQDVSPKKNILCGNYGVNRSVCKDSPGLTGVTGSEFIGKPLSSTSIRNASQTLLIADSGYSLVSWKAADSTASPVFENPKRENFFYIPGISFNETRTLNINITPMAVSGRHPKKKVNLAYSDTHVSSVHADDLTVQNNAGNYVNRSSLWEGK